MLTWEEDVEAAALVVGIAMARAASTTSHRAPALASGWNTASQDLNAVLK